MIRQLSPVGKRALDDIASRHGFSAQAVLSMLESVVNGNGTMAQFSHPEFSGSGQWMSGGMTMVSDMFNQQLKNRVNSLCSDLARLLGNQSDWLESTASESPGQGGHPRHQADWWPADLHRPNSTGGQNSVRYAYFAQARRLAIELDGKVTVYDTLDHRISGFSQQQSGGSLLTFCSQHGVVDVSGLPVVAPR